MPVNYDEMFGGGAMGAHFALQDRDMEREAKQGQMRQQELANMFAEQNNPMRLQEQQMQLEGIGYDNQTKAQAAKLAPLKYNDEQAKFINSIKKAELDGMQLEADRMAYEGARSGNKQMVDQANEIRMLHRDFLKLREQGDQKKEVVDQRTQSNIQVEKIKQAGRVALKQTTPAARPGGSGGGRSGGALTESKVLAPLLQQAVDMQAKGDTEGANKMLLQYQLAKQAQAAGRADPNAGKPALADDGSITKTPPRAAVQFPGGKPSLPSGWTMK